MAPNSIRDFHSFSEKSGNILYPWKVLADTRMFTVPVRNQAIL